MTVKPGERSELRYLGLESIESGTGLLALGELSKTPSDPQANSFAFGASHVLYGKLRPYLNKVLVPEFDGKCSTEIVPLLPSEDLDRQYLAYFLRSTSTVSKISAKTAGARMPRADMDFVFDLRLRLPPLPQQCRIVDLLSRAEGIVRLRREAQAKAQAIIPALFLDMFGDPATNPKGWPIATMSDLLLSADYGSSRKASNARAGLPLIRMGNVAYDGKLDLADLKYVALEPSEVERYGLEKGDLLFNRTNSKELVGKTGLWEGSMDAVAASYFIRLRVDKAKTCPFYLWALMNTRHMKRVLLDTARGAIGQANINSKELKAFSVQVPPLEAQRRFEERGRSILEVVALQADAILKAEATFQALLARAFGGDSKVGCMTV